MAKKKILFVITKSNFGGAQRYVHDLAVGLPSSRFDSSVALGGGGVLAAKLEAAGIPVITIPGLARDINPASDLSVFWFLLKLFRKEHPDVVHLNSSKIGGLGAFAARLSGVPRIIFTAHGWAFNEDRSFLSRLVIRILYWITIQLCHQTIAVSEGTREQVESWPGCARKMTVIYNGISLDGQMDREDARNALQSHGGLRDKLSNDPHLPLIATVAELHPIKRHIDALAAIHALPFTHEFIYVIAGDGEERANLESAIHRLSLHNRVVLLGHLPDASRYMKAFDAFLLPSRSEALAYVILEAGVASLPVIASRVGGIPEIIEDKTNGLLVSPEHPSEIRDALANILNNPEAAKALGRRLNEKVRTGFTLSEMIEKTARVYGA